MTSSADPQRAAIEPPQIAVETDEFVLWSVQSGPFANNTYLVVDRATGRGALVDPFYDSLDRYRPILDELSDPLDAILITHAHIDHVCGVASLISAYPNAKIFAHEEGVPLMMAEDVPTLTGGTNSLTDYAEQFDFPAFEPSSPTDYLHEGEAVHVGETRLDVLSTPGHSPGHVAFLNGNTLISGDVLYRGSVGFTHIPGSDPDVLADTIIDTILPLGDEVAVYPGHGGTTTVGRERTTNSFILDALNARE